MDMGEEVALNGVILDRKDFMSAGQSRRDTAKLKCAFLFGFETPPTIFS